MKSPSFTFLLVAFVFAATNGIHATTKSDLPDFTPLSEFAVSAPQPVQWETQLIRENAGKFKLADVSVPDTAPDVPETRPDLLILERFVVTKRAPEKLQLPPPETVMQTFFKTGTFAEHVGKKVTVRFWMHPWKGLMLSFEF